MIAFLSLNLMSFMFDPHFFGVSFTSRVAQVHHWRGKVLPVNWTEVELEVLRTQKPMPDVQAEVLLKRTATEMRSWMDEGQRRMNCFGEIPQFQFHHFASTLWILPQHFNVEALIFERCWWILSLLSEALGTLPCRRTWTTCLASGRPLRLPECVDCSGHLGFG